MNTFGYIVGVPLFLLIVYLSVRLASSAYFRSKRDYYMNTFRKTRKGETDAR